MKNTTFKAIAIFLAIFGTAWTVKLMTDSPKEIDVAIYQGENSIQRSQIDKSDEINSEFRKVDEMIQASNDSLVRNVSASTVWEAYDSAR